MSCTARDKITISEGVAVDPAHMCTYICMYIRTYYSRSIYNGTSGLLHVMRKCSLFMAYGRGFGGEKSQVSDIGGNPRLVKEETKRMIYHFFSCVLIAFYTTPAGQLQLTCPKPLNV